MVMNNQDLERLSAAMDGELNQDLGHLLGDKRHDEAFQDHWFMFHLIGDVLRDDTIPHALVHPQVSEALKKEPVYLLPTGGVTSAEPSSTVKFRWLAVAAAIFMVMLSTAMLRPQSAPMLQLAQQSEIKPVVNPNADHDIQTFVALHRQGSPLSEFQTVDYTPASERD